MKPTVRFQPATSNITWVPFSFGTRGTKRAFILSKLIAKCPYLQLVAVRGLDLSRVPLHRVVAVEEAWSSATLQGALKSEKRTRDWFLFGNADEVRANNEYLLYRFRAYQIKHDPLDVGEGFVEVHPRSGQPITDYYRPELKRRLVIDSFGLLRVPTQENRRLKPGSPLCMREDWALSETRLLLKRGYVSTVFHLQPWRPSWEARKLLGVEVERLRMMQWDEFLSGDPKGYLYHWVNTIGKHYATKGTDKKHVLCMVYEVGPTKVFKISRMVQRTRDILEQYVDLV